MKTITVTIAWLVLFVNISNGQQASTPPPGSPLRKALMDALRVPLEKELKQPLVFKMKFLKVKGEWAFGEFAPQRKDNKPINYRNTPYEEVAEEGMMDEWSCALWHREKGKWTVQNFVLGPTDLPYGCWWKQFNVPKEIFTYTEKDCKSL